MPGLYSSLDRNPLGRPSIRLLQLDPILEKGGHPSISLNAVFLEDAPPYEALSYVWGDATRKVPISCNGRPFYVTKNLFAALSHLGHPSRTRQLWVDAICINQEDASERSHQVGIMDQIYQVAQQVLVWLGHAEGASHLAFNFVHRAYTHLRVALEQPVPRDKRFPSVLLDSLLQHTGRKRFRARWSLEEELWPDAWRYLVADLALARDEDRAFHAILHRPWWTRVWVIQEFCLPRNITMICGDQSASWSEFAAALFALGINSYIGVPDTVNVWILSRTRYTVQRGTRPNLLSLLVVFRWFRATDPRDKVYSLLGLAESRLNVVPDYRISVEECYRRLAVSNLRSATSRGVGLSILNWVVAPSSVRRRKLPSWVPDWSYNEAPMGRRFRRFERISSVDAILMDRYGSLRKMDIVTLLPDDREVSVRFEGDEVLVIQGMLTGSIALVDNVISFPSRQYINSVVATVPERWANRLWHRLSIVWETILTSHRAGTWVHEFDRWLTIASSVQTRLGRYDPLDAPLMPIRVLLKTLACGHVSDSQLDDIILEFAGSQKGLVGAPFARILRSFRIHKIASGFYKFCLGFAWYQLQLRPIGKQNLDSGRGLAASVDQRLARTNDGLLSIVPNTCRIGDRVAFLEGSDVPYIVRASGSCWELLGPSYIYGLNQREIWDYRKASNMRFI